MELVSVVIPTFNRACLIVAAIDSVLDQTHPHYEIIVVDDGSTDDTGQRLRERYGSRIRYVYQENQGESAARNRGIALAKGALVAFLDSDDIWLPSKLEEQVAALRARLGSPMVFCQVLLVDKDGRDLDQAPLGTELTQDTVALEQVYQGNVIVNSTVLARRSALESVGGFDPQIRYGEDWDLWVRLATLGELLLLPKPLTKFRLYSQGQSRVPSVERAQKELADHLYILEKNVPLLKGRLSPETMAVARANRYADAGWVCYSVGETDLAQRYFSIVYDLCPTYFADFADVVHRYALRFGRERPAWDPIRFVETVYRHPPPPLHAYRQQGQVLQGKLWMQRGFESYRARRWRDAFWSTLRGVERDGQWLRNRGVQAILVKSLWRWIAGSVLKGPAFT